MWPLNSSSKILRTWIFQTMSFTEKYQSKRTFFLLINILFDNFWITEKLILNFCWLGTVYLQKSFNFLWVQRRILVKNQEKFWLLQKEFYPIVYISLQTTWNILICRWHLHWKIIWISKLQNKKMAHRTMPILYLNLCGEMLYIIDQRLIDTKTDPEKQIKGTTY